MKKLIKLTAVMLIATLLLSGCQKIMLIPGKTTAPEESVTEQTSSYVEEVVKDFPVILNDTEITKAVETVISLTPAYTEILYEMGYGNSLVGVCDYCDYPEAVSSVQTVGSSTAPDISKITSIKPDLVITATPLITKDRIAIEAKGIKILTISSPKTIQEFQNVYKFIGLAFEGLLHGEDKGISSYKAVQSKINDAAKTQKKSFVYISPTMALAGGDTFEHNVLSLFGENKAKKNNGYADPTEELLENQPEIIFLSDRFEISDIKEHEIFSQLDAVANGKVIIVESIYFERPTSRITKLFTHITDSIKAIEEGNHDTSSSEETGSEEEEEESTEEEADETYDDEYYEE